MRNIETFKRALNEKRALKIISGINNIDLLKIDFNTNRIDYKDASYTYANDYVIKKIENKKKSLFQLN